MQKDRDGKVDYVEFKKYLRSRRHGYHVKRDLFDRLANNELVGFWEVMTLVSKRPFRNKCDEFLVGNYFACVRYFEGSKDPYCICIHCLRCLLLTLSTLL